MGRCRWQWLCRLLSNRLRRTARTTERRCESAEATNRPRTDVSDEWGQWFRSDQQSATIRTLLSAKATVAPGLIYMVMAAQSPADSIAAQPFVAFGMRWAARPKSSSERSTLARSTGDAGLMPIQTTEQIFAPLSRARQKWLSAICRMASDSLRPYRCPLQGLHHHGIVSSGET